MITLFGLGKSKKGCTNFPLISGFEEQKKKLSSPIPAPIVSRQTI